MSAGTWTLGRSCGKADFKKALNRLLDSWEASEVDPGTAASPVYTIVVAPCCPADSLATLARSPSFPAKLAAKIAGPARLTWLLRERDIDVDIAAFNAACAETFVERARTRPGKSRIVYARHWQLDAQELSRCVLTAYGKTACSLAERPSYRALVDLNCLAARYSSRTSMRKLPEYKLAAREAI